jgi:hypothetical protein
MKHALALALLFAACGRTERPVAPPSAPEPEVCLVTYRWVWGDTTINLAGVPDLSLGGDGEIIVTDRATGLRYSARTGALLREVNSPALVPDERK